MSHSRLNDSVSVGVDAVNGLRYIRDFINLTTPPSEDQKFSVKWLLFKNPKLFNSKQYGFTLLDRAAYNLKNALKSHSEYLYESKVEILCTLIEMATIDDLNKPTSDRHTALISIQNILRGYHHSPYIQQNLLPDNLHDKLVRALKNKGVELPEDISEKQPFQQEPPSVLHQFQAWQYFIMSGRFAQLEACPQVEEHSPETQEDGGFWVTRAMDKVEADAKRAAKAALVSVKVGLMPNSRSVGRAF